VSVTSAPRLTLKSLSHPAVAPRPGNRLFRDGQEHDFFCDAILHRFISVFEIVFLLSSLNPCFQINAILNGIDIAAGMAEGQNNHFSESDITLVPRTGRGCHA